MQPRVNPAVVEMAARILQEDPAISNLQMLQRLTHHFGRGLALEIPVTRMERMVRDPALLLLRRPRSTPVQVAAPPPAEVAPTPEAEVPQAPRPRRAAPRKKRRRSASPPPPPRSMSPEVLASALLQAFQLGAEAESSADLVEAYAKLRRLQDEIERTLAEPVSARQNRPDPSSD
jgi:hypothetical protein